MDATWRKGAFYKPTVITDIPKTADVATDMEIFGPVVSIIPFDTVDEAVELANASKFGLCGCVFMVYAAFAAYGKTVVFYLIVYVVIMIIGNLFYRKKA